MHAHTQGNKITCANHKDAFVWSGAYVHTHTHTHTSTHTHAYPHTRENNHLCKPQRCLCLVRRNATASCIAYTHVEDPIHTALKTYIHACHIICSMGNVCIYLYKFKCLYVLLSTFTLETPCILIHTCHIICSVGNVCIYFYTFICLYVPLSTFTLKTQSILP